MERLPASPVDPLAALLGYQLRRLSLLVMADLAETLQPLGLRTGEATVLLATGANPGITQSELGRMLGIKRANMAPLVAGLEARGLVRRAPMDGRSQALSLTVAGEALAGEVRAATQDNEARCFAAMPEAERQRLAAALQSTWVRLDGAGQQGRAERG